MGTLANSEDPDLHHLLKLKHPSLSSGTEIHPNLEISSYDPLNYTMGNTYRINVIICMGRTLVKSA